MRHSKMMLKFSILVLAFALVSFSAVGQSGKGGGSGRRVMTLNVIVHAPEGVTITKDFFDLYDSGVHQEVDSFSRMDSGSRIVLMIDSSQNLKIDTAALSKVVVALINELYEDDEMMIVGFNESAEIIEDMTPDLKKLQTSPTKLVRKGFPNLYDALIAVSDALSHQAKTGMEKRAIILISDGYDSESKTKFDDMLATLQEENVVLFAIQTPDRTRGALLRDKPKPPAALEKLTTGTGGAIFSATKIEEAAKAISEDLRKNWYRLVYTPSGINTINLRRFLLISHDQKITLRTKGSHPGTFR